MTETDLWTDDGVCEGGTVGGDGAGEAFERRFHRQLEDGTYAVVDSYYYPVNIGERFNEEREPTDEWDVENMTMATICTDIEDVGMSEIWSDIDFDFPSEVSFPTEDDAILYAKRAAGEEWGGMYGDPANWGLK